MFTKSRYLLLCIWVVMPTDHYFAGTRSKADHRFPIQILKEDFCWLPAATKASGGFRRPFLQSTDKGQNAGTTSDNF